MAFDRSDWSQNIHTHHPLSPQAMSEPRRAAWTKDATSGKVNFRVVSGGSSLTAFLALPKLPPVCEASMIALRMSRRGAAGERRFGQ